MQTPSLKTDALVQQYVHVVNEAIGQHKDEVPYKQLLGAIEATAGDVEAGIAVYKDDIESPHDHFVLAWHDGSLKMLAHGKEGDRTWWNMPRRHFEEVVQNPQTYIENPMKLDLDWMMRRVGLKGEDGVMPTA